ncbi:alpha/beta hydrolase [Myroides injenensis]|uniref:alpha/beta hydrolase n=1 Tax=Myroides injenensis TaxID=1183151 RepID=UPI0022719554|nr:alpha/beta hydrolase-fold protein [Myroides injenensis]
MKRYFIITLLALTATLSLKAQTVSHINVYSEKMNKEIETIVITPDYTIDKQYPAVYILHGYSGNPQRALSKDIPDLIAKSKEYQTIYILPNGNYNSWYVDSPINTNSQYQTFIGKELVKYVDQHYPTITDRNKRGILGWSMGGYGALNIGIYYHDTFSIVGSTCGALDFTKFGESYHNYQVDKVLGPLDNLNKEYLTFNKVPLMKLAQQNYILDCGSEDIEMIEMNREFHHILTTHHIDHYYTESLGEHNTAYWSKALSNQLALFNNLFNQ